MCYFMGGCQEWRCVVLFCVISCCVLLDWVREIDEKKKRDIHLSFKKYIEENGDFVQHHTPSRTTTIILHCSV